MSRDLLPRVVLLGVDGFPFDAFSPEQTPRLWALGAAGGCASGGGRTPLPSSTYPGFATLLTGCLPRTHLVRSTAIGRVAPRWAGERRVAVPTLFDACRAAGLASAAIQGDHLLHEVLRTEAADLRWPPGGNVPAGTPLDVHGYPNNAAVRPHLLEAVRDARLAFVFGHLNETDSLGHDLGPAHPRTRACCAEIDAMVGEVLDALADDWVRTVLLVVSDHDMEPRTALPPIDLASEFGISELADDVWPDGGAALVRLRAGVAPAPAAAALRRVEGIADTELVGPDILAVGAERGRLFRNTRYSAGGYHGGSATARTLALVAGGHAAVPLIAASIRARPPHLADWAPTVAGLLGIPLTAVDGRNLASA